ncbi:type II toxin-antitoxin system PemK/MazF family toxin, partial [Belliella aquatica]
MGKKCEFKFKTVLVSFPFEDFKSHKVRPALCLTEPIGDHEHIVLAFISSKVPDFLDESDLLVDIDADLGETTGLIKNSVIRFHKIISIPKSLIKRQLGYIHGRNQNYIHEKKKK